MTVYFCTSIREIIMFPDECRMSIVQSKPVQVRRIVEKGVVSCIGRSQRFTIEALRRRFGIVVDIQARLPKVKLAAGDNILVMSVRGLPQERECTQAEIDAAEFKFSIWGVFLL